MLQDREPSRRNRSTHTLREMLQRIRLGWHLFRDDRISPFLKAIPVLGLVYLIWPGDLLPDLFPALGQLDDIAVILLTVNWFIQACPSYIVEELRAEIESVPGSYSVVEEDDLTKWE